MLKLDIQLFGAGGQKSATSKSAGSYKTFSSSAEHRELFNKSRAMWGNDMQYQEGYVRTALAFHINDALRKLDDDADITKADLGKGNHWTTGEVDFNKVVQNMDQLTSKEIPGGENRVLTRFVGEGWAQGALGINDLREFNNNLKGLGFKEKGFMSTSTVATDNVFTGRPIKMEIEAPKGTRGFVANNVGESEVVLPRNSQFKVVSSKYENGSVTLRVKVVKTPNNGRGFAGDPHTGR